MPGATPTDLKEFNRFLYYDRDIGSATSPLPKHRVRWNWNYELPFGKGRTFARNASGFVQGLIGGWKLSGSGTVLNTWFAQPTSHWGEFGKFEVYGKKYKILDCRATPAAATTAREERCTPGYLWHNGYLSQAVLNRKNAAGLRTGVFGLPENYQPAQKPRWPAPPPRPDGSAGPLPEGYRSVNDYDTNVTYIRLKNGNEVRVNYDTGLHQWRNQYFLGPFNWVTDASLLKFFRVNEKVRVRVNLDVFNVFNVQGFNPPNAEGIVSLGSSFGNFAFRPRQLQATVRVEW